MPTVVVAPSLVRWLTPAPTTGAGERSCVVAGTTVRQVLEALFAEYPVLRGYATDEHGALRHHVVDVPHAQRALARRDEPRDAAARRDPDHVVG